MGTMVRRTRLNIELYVHCLSCYIQMSYKDSVFKVLCVVRRLVGAIKTAWVGAIFLVVNCLRFDWRHLLLVLRIVFN